jgi:hypothetical protein
VFGSQILDVAIGLIFVYLLVSLIVSIVNEWISRLFALRASTLEDGLRNLLQDPAPANKEAKSLLDYLYNHPLIQGASPLRNRVKLVWPKLPVGTHTRGVGRAQRARHGEELTLAGAEDVLEAATRTGRPSYIDPRHFSLALLDLVAPEGTHAGQIETVKTEIRKIENARLRRTLLALVDTAQTDVETARASIEKWFNTGMERVSGWYKRKIQIIGLCLGLALAIVLNADTLSIVRTLWTQPLVRDALARSAEQYVQQSASGDPNSSFDSQRQKLQTSLGQLSAVNLPIGWSLEPSPQGTPPDGTHLPDLVSSVSGPLPGSVLGVLSKLVGLVLTGAAVSLGAHFWFDALSRITSLRSSGTPPATNASGDQAAGT